jgi:hypothetical protein
MCGYQLDHTRFVTKITQLGFRLFQQVFDFALVWSVAKQTLADGHRPVHKRCCRGIVGMTVMTELRHGSKKISLGRESSERASFAMAIRAVFSGFVYVPDGLSRLINLLSVWIEKRFLEEVLLQRRDSVEKVTHDFMSLNLVATADKNGKKDEEREPDRSGSISKQL